MWLSILAILDGGLRAINALLDYLTREEIKESGRTEEKLKSAEVTLERQRITDETNLEPVPSDKHIVLAGM